MKSTSALPEGYHEICAIDLQKNKKLMTLVNGFALVIMALMTVPMLFVVPFDTLKDAPDFFQKFWLILVALGYIIYIVLHEAVHGIAMKICGTQRVKYGFTGVYAFAGSDDYYGKGAYIFIALAPVVLFGVLFAILNLVLPLYTFWAVYILQIGNLSGAAGDFYVTCKFMRLPSDILVTDYGVGMKVYSKSE